MRLALSIMFCIIYGYYAHGFILKRLIIKLLDLTRSATLQSGFCQIPMLFSFNLSHFDDEIG